MATTCFSIIFFPPGKKPGWSHYSLAAPATGKGNSYLFYGKVYNSSSLPAFCGK
jgi:hypothetical protein